MLSRSDWAYSFHLANMKSLNVAELGAQRGAEHVRRLPLAPVARGKMGCQPPLSDRPRRVHTTACKRCCLAALSHRWRCVAAACTILTMTGRRRRCFTSGTHDRLQTMLLAWPRFHTVGAVSQPRLELHELRDVRHEGNGDAERESSNGTAPAISPRVA